MKPRRLMVMAFVLAVAISCSRDPEVAKREYLASGDQFMTQKKVKEAIVQYRNAVAQDPRFGEARYKLAEAYSQDGDIRRASREYIRAADLLPNDAQAQLKAGRFLLVGRQFEDAKTRAAKAIELDPKNVEAQVLLGNALAGLNDLDGAVDQIQEAIKLDPENALGYLSLGAMEQAAGKPEEAEAAFKMAVDAEPKSVAARLALANFYWATRKAGEAGQTLQQAYDLEPDNLRTNHMLAMFQIATGKAADAERYFKKLAELSKDKNAKIILADYYVAAGRSNDALPILQALTTSKDTQAAADLRLAELDYRDGRHQQAHDRIDDLLERERNNATALVLKGRFLLAERKIDDAVARLQAAVKANPGSAEAQFALGNAYVAKSDREQAIRAFNETIRLNPRAVAAQLALSRLELAGGRPDSSVDLAERALKNAPESPVAKLALVRGLLARGDLRRAEGEIDALLQKYPDDSQVLTQAGILANLKGDHAQATRLLVNALGVDEGNLEALTALISLDLSQKDAKAAVSRVESYLARTPDNPAVLLLAARTYAATRDPKKTEQMLRKAIEVDSSNIQAYGMLGGLYLSQRRLDEALKEFDALAERQPKSVQAHTLAGIILEAQKNGPEAKKRYEQALAIDPEAAVAANNLAWMLAETGGNLDVALQLAQTAVRRLPEHPAVQDTLGWVYYKKGLAALAVAPFQKSVEKDPKNPVYHFHLGLAHAKTGDSPNARLALQQALTLAPNFNGAVEAKQMLASLKG
ncbi:MAG TPA: tetratricopeptide repeat protein [Vicinamibacterales bacterium]